MLELLHQALFAFISGFSEFIFVPTAAHQMLYQTVTGCDLGNSPLLLGIHLGALVALVIQCQKRLQHLRAEKRWERSSKHRRGRQSDGTSLVDIRILNTVVIPLLLGSVFYLRSMMRSGTLAQMALIVVLNGMVLFLPRLFSSGNKNGRSLSPFDCFLMGLGGALGFIPGFTRLGCMYSIGTARGTDKNYALDISMLLSIPAMVVMICFDLYGCVTSAGVMAFQFLGGLVAGIASFFGAYLAVGLMRIICSRTTTAGFAYYNWGMAMFLFLIYLFVA